MVGVGWMAIHFGPGITLALMGLLLAVMITTAVVALGRGYLILTFDNKSLVC